MVAALFRLRGLRAVVEGSIWAAMRAEGFRPHDDETLTLIGRPGRPAPAPVPTSTSCRSPSRATPKMAMDLRARVDGEGSLLETRDPRPAHGCRDGGASRPTGS